MKILFAFFLSSVLALAQTNFDSRTVTVGPELGTGSSTNGGLFIIRNPVPGASGTTVQTYANNLTVNRDGTVNLRPFSTDPTINLGEGNLWFNTPRGLQQYHDSFWRNVGNTIPGRYIEIYTDCFGSPGMTTGAEWLTSTASAGEFSSDAVNHLGVFNLATGAGTTGSGYLRTSLNAFRLAGGSYLFDYGGRTPSTLSDGTDTYTTWYGFGNSVTATNTMGVGFRYTHSVNSGKFQCVAISGGVEVTADSGITDTTSTWGHYVILVDASAANAYFYYAGYGSAPVLVGTISSGIPIGSSADMGVVVSIQKSAGTNSRGILTDYCSLVINLTSSR